MSLNLSPRQLEVCRALVTTDGTDRAIAEQLGISPATVRVHFVSIRNKLHLHTRVQVAVWYMREVK